MKSFEGWKMLDFEIENEAGKYVCIELQFSYTYSYDPGKYSGRPEDCYPAEEEKSFYLEPGWEDKVTAICPRKALTNIATVIEACELIDIAALAHEDACNREADWAEMRMEEERERRMFGCQ